MKRQPRSLFTRPHLLVSIALACPALAIACGSSGDDTAANNGYGGSATSGGAGHGGGSVVANGGSAATGGRTTTGGSSSAGTVGSGGGAEAGAGGAAELVDFAVKRTDLDSDQTGAAQQDGHLLNAWGIAINPSAELFWVAANHDGSVPVYDATGAQKPLDPKVAPVAGTDPGSPTGQVFNGGTEFMADKFIVDTEDGQILGWAGTGDFSPRAAKPSAIYKGLALVGSGATQLLAATDFHDGSVDLYDAAYAPVDKPGRFVDPAVAAGFAPFNIIQIEDQVYVTYAKQDADKADDERGAGNGYVSVFTADGTLVKTLVAGGELDSPWAVALAPASFDRLAGALLIGNFGDGAVHAYDRQTGSLVGRLTNAAGGPLVILGLWDIKVGPAGATDLSHTLFFSAGPGAETHGVFGKLEAASAP